MRVTVALDAKPHVSEGEHDGPVAADCGLNAAAEKTIGQRRVALAFTKPDAVDGVALLGRKDLHGEAP